MKDRVLEVEGLAVRFGEREIFSEVSFHVERGEFLCLLGPNGAGKSTLLKTMLGFIQPTRGKVQVLGLPPGGAEKRIGYVPQLKQFERSFPATVVELIVANLRGSWPIRIRPAERERAQAVLARVKGERLIDLRLGGLSGGECQRAFIARALVNDPELIFLDEPATGVDAGGREDLYDLLHHISADEHIAAVMVTHSPTAIARTAEKIVLIDGTVRAFGLPEELMKDGRLFSLMGLSKPNHPAAGIEEG
jgi:zinc transport system ATP-binding protein